MTIGIKDAEYLKQFIADTLAILKEHTDTIGLLNLKRKEHSEKINILIANYKLVWPITKAMNAMLQDYEFRIRKLEETIKEYEDTFAIQKYTKMIKN